MKAPARIAILGCGGLGVPAAWTLVLGGIRHLRLVDRDCVELSNLHRQVLYSMADIGQPKAKALARHLSALVDDLDIEIVEESADLSSIQRLLQGCMAVLEATDDPACKFAVCDAAAHAGMVASIAAAIGQRGQWFGQRPGGACYRCLFEIPPDPAQLATCSLAGVLGPITGQVGAMAAQTLIHLLQGQPDAADGALVRLNARGLLRTAVTIAGDCTNHLS